MPVYDFACTDCGKVNSDMFFHSWKDSNEPMLCACGASMQKVVGNIRIVPDVFPAEGIFLEHVSADGKTFKSKQEMKDFEKMSGMTIGMLH